MDFIPIILGSAAVAALTYIALMYNEEVIDPNASEEQRQDSRDSIDIGSIKDIDFTYDPHTSPHGIHSQILEQQREKAKKSLNRTRARDQKDGIYLSDYKTYDVRNHDY